MPMTITKYNSCILRFVNGSNVASDTYKIKLLSAATFNAAHTTLAATGGTEVTNDGYTAGGQALANVAITAFSTAGAKFSADNTSWTATGADIVASYAIIYNDTDADDPPVAFIDFDGAKTAGDGTAFLVRYDATNGIVQFGPI